MVYGEPIKVSAEVSRLSNCKYSKFALQAVLHEKVLN